MRLKDFLLGVLVTVIWGSNFSVIEVGLRDLDPFLLTALRFAFTALPLMVFVRRPVNVPLSAVATYGVLFGIGLWFVVNLSMSRGCRRGCPRSRRCRRLRRRTAMGKNGPLIKGPVYL